jgi:excisionase family DNA binding protein
MVQAEKAYYTPQDLAVTLDVSVATVLRKAQAGELPALKFGRQWRFPRQKVEAWLEQAQQRQPTASESLPTDELDAETRAWVDAELTEPLPPYEWGPAGIPPVKPVRYKPGVGFVVEEEA